MIYLVCFAASAGFAYLANKTTNRKNLYIFSFCSIAIIVLLAGLRDYSVGIDTLNYFKKQEFWRTAFASDSIFDYLKTYSTFDDGDYLFAFLLGIIAKWTGSYTVFLTFAHLIIITFVYIGVFRQRDKINPAIVLLVFYLFFFNHSLNIFRQYMAMAIIFAFLADIEKKKYLRYIIAVLIASSIHSTAILGLAPLILYFFLNYKNDKIKLTKLTLFQRELIVTGCLVLIVALFSPIITLLTKIGLLNKRFLFYLRDDAISPSVIISGVIILGLVGVFYFKNEILKKHNFSRFYIMCSVVYLIIMQITFFIAYGKRIALYFAFADLITIGLVANAPKDKKTKLIVNGAIILVAFAYWLYVYVFRNASKTIPYAFCF